MNKALPLTSAICNALFCASLLRFSLKDQLEELKKNVEEKDSTIEEAEKELDEIKNFYVDLNKSSITGRKGNEEGVVFSFKKSKK